MRTGKGDKRSVPISEMTVKYARVRVSPSPLKYKIMAKEITREEHMKEFDLLIKQMKEKNMEYIILPLEDE